MMMRTKRAANRPRHDNFIGTPTREPMDSCDSWKNPLILAVGGHPRQRPRTIHIDDGAQKRRRWERATCPSCGLAAKEYSPPGHRRHGENGQKSWTWRLTLDGNHPAEAAGSSLLWR